MHRCLSACTLAVFSLSSLSSLAAQQPLVASDSPSRIPAYIHFSGSVADSDQNQPASINFALYSEAEGGSPLWIETQSVSPDKTGHYAVDLGVTTEGLPPDLFTAGQARWLGIQIAGEAEQRRVLLVAVPYALKAADAETLGGLHASDFQLARPASAAQTFPARATSQAVKAAATAITGGGTAGYVPLWSSASSLSNSILFQKTGFLGLGTVGPTALFDVNGKANLRDSLTLYPKGTDPTLQISGTTFKIDQTGKITFIPGQLFPGTGTLTGITTGATSGLIGGGLKGTLNLSIKPAGISNAMLLNPGLTIPVTAPLIGGGAVTLGGSAPAISLKLCPAGQALFSNGSTWGCATLAGSGTVKSVALSAPTSDFTVTGSPVTSNGTLGLNWTVSPSATNVANAIVKRDANGDIAAHTITAQGTLVTKSDLYVSGNTVFGGLLGVGTAAPVAELNLNSYGTSSRDTLLLGSKSKGLQLRDTGTGVDIESYGVPLYMNEITSQPTIFGSPAYFNGGVGIGTATPQASLNLNAGGTANADTLLLGNNTTRGLQLRNNGGGVDLESIGVPLYVNDVTQQPVFLDPVVNPALASVIIGSTDPTLGYASNGGDHPVLAVGAARSSLGQYYSAFFSNDVVIDGNLRVNGSKNFHIPHPLDPEHKFLDHAAIESSEVLNQYSGNAVLNEKGEARIEFPEWFSAINTDFRYQLTAVGAPGPGLYVSEEVSGNHFSIAGGRPGSKVSWQVTARRNDEYMREHPFQLETEKTKPI